MAASLAIPPCPPVAAPGAARGFWFRHALPFLVARLFTGGVRVAGAERVPRDGPVLFVGRHRAGLMDGWLCAHAVPRPTVFVVAARLRRHALLRPLAGGIAVMRRKDGGGGRAAANAAALRACRAELADGRTLFIFPEGTSSLGDQPLPLEPGAALLARAVPGTAVVPVAVRYADPRSLRTGVTVTFGPPHRLDGAATLEETQATLAAMLASLPEGLPRRPARAAALLDAPVWWAAAGLGRFLADDDTAVLTWATIVGLPLQLLWSVAVPAAGLLAGQGWLAAAYGASLLLRLTRRTERRRA